MHNSGMNVKLLVARKQLEMTQDDLAEKAGIPQADISRIESRGWIPPKDIQERLATALATTPDELFAQGADIAS